MTPAATVAAVTSSISFDPSSLINSMGSWAVLGIALIIFAECGILLGFFLPGDTLLFVSGLLLATAEGGANGLHINIVWFIVLIAIAAFVGNLVGYGIGRAVGPKVFHRKDAKLLKAEYVERSHRYFERFGPVTVVLARFVPVVRTVATVMAGVGKMNVKLYAAFSALGGLLWVAVVTLAGYFLGHVAFVRDHVDMIFVGAVVIVVLAATAPAFLHWRERRNAARSGAGSGVSPAVEGGSGVRPMVEGGSDGGSAA